MGKFIHSRKSIAHTDSFESRMMLIATDYFSQIEEEILFTLEDEGHRVVVREIGPTIHQYISGITKHSEAHSPLVMPLGLMTLKKTTQMNIVAPGISTALTEDLSRTKQSKSHRKWISWQSEIVKTNSHKITTVTPQMQEPKLQILAIMATQKKCSNSPSI